MKRITLVVVGVLIATHPVFAGDDGVKKTIAYVQRLQTDSGGFLRQHSQGGQDSPADASCHLGGYTSPQVLRRRLAQQGQIAKFVESCWNAEAGEFADEPKGKPDVFTTAVGLMAVVELKMPADKYVDAATKYLNANAKSFEEIRIAAAGFEAIKKQPANQERWYIDVYRKGEKTGGIYGKGPGMARDTGSAVVTLMRLGDKLPEPQLKAVRRALNDGQRQSGGWGKADSETASDLETTYRVMRCYHMLKANPGNVEGVRSFVAKCRNSDGGYAVAPGQPSSVSGAYFAGIVLHWLRENPK